VFPQHLVSLQVTSGDAQPYRAGWLTAFALGPACSASHVPGYLNSPKLKDAGPVFVVSVNDAFVMGAWAKSLDPSGKIRFLADPSLALTNALDVAFDGTAIFGGHRSKRYALRIEDGKVAAVHLEPDNTGLNGKCPNLDPIATPQSRRIKARCANTSAYSETDCARLPQT
jgi:hypothetical protein